MLMSQWFDYHPCSNVCVHVNSLFATEWLLKYGNKTPRLRKLTFKVPSQTILSLTCDKN